MKKLFLLSILILFNCSDDCNCDDNNTSNNNDPNPVVLNEWIPGSNLGNPQREYSDSNSSLVSATVSKMIEFNGELYVGGDFQVIGGQIIKYLAKWDGVNWSSIGQLDSPVEDMIVFQQKLYIQVQENELSNTNEYQCSDCNRIYSWDGNFLTWEQLNYQPNIGAPVINNPLYSKKAFGNSGGTFIGEKKYEQWTVHDNKLFAFVKTNQQSSSDGFGFELLSFDGNSWQNFNPDLQTNYHGVLKSYNGELYATLKGSHSSLEGGLYKLDTFEAWDNGILYAWLDWVNVAGQSLSDPEILTITEFNNNLIIGGNFETIGGVVAQNIAKFDGTNWSSFGNWPYEPYELKVFNNQLYASFYNGNWNGSDFERIAVYNGNYWDSLLYNLSDFDIVSDGVHNTITMFQDYLYLGGSNSIIRGTNNFIKLAQ